MIFKLSVKSKIKILSFPKNSAKIIFVKNNSDFKNYLNKNKIEISSSQKSKFIDEENSELQIWDSQSPELLIIKKIDVNKKFTRDYFRNYLAGIIQSLEKLNISNLIIASLDYPSYKKYFESEDYLYQSMLEGVYLGNYNYDKYFTKEKKQKSLGVVLEIADAKLAGAILKISKNVAESVYFSRDLVNEPANILTPIEFAKRVKDEFGKTSISVKIFNEAELKKEK